MGVQIKDRCQFHTTKPLPALLQAAQSGSPTRYRQCRNKAKHTIVITRRSLTSTYDTEVRCCSLHKRLHDKWGWTP